MKRRTYFHNSAFRRTSGPQSQNCCYFDILRSYRTRHPLLHPSFSLPLPRIHPPPPTPSLQGLLPLPIFRFRSESWLRRRRCVIRCCQAEEGRCQVPKLRSFKFSVVSTYRDHFHSQSKSVLARQVMAELFN